MQSAKIKAMPVCNLQQRKLSLPCFTPKGLVVINCYRRSRYIMNANLIYGTRLRSTLAWITNSAIQCMELLCLCPIERRH